MSPATMVSLSGRAEGVESLEGREGLALVGGGTPFVLSDRGGWVAATVDSGWNVRVPSMAKWSLKEHPN